LDLACLVVQALGHIQIPQLGIPVLVQQNVGRLDVTMQHTQGMQRRQGLQALHQVHPHHAFIHPFPPGSVPLDLPGQVLEAAVLHDDAQVRGPVHERLVAADDARVPEGGQQPDFIQGHGQVPSIEAIEVDALDGIGVVVGLAHHLVHAPIGPQAQLGQDAKVLDGRG
jgi:hypothetical protein